MKQLVTESKELMEIVNKIQKRNECSIPKNELEILEYEFFERGLFTTCVLTYRSRNEIMEIGNAIKNKKDKYNFQIAMNVCFSKAIRNYYNSDLILRIRHHVAQERN